VSRCTLATHHVGRRVTWEEWDASAQQSYRITGEILVHRRGACDVACDDGLTRLGVPCASVTPL
jgi:hypothetical protein